MKQAITNLSKQQNTCLHKLLTYHNLDTKTSTKTQKYYRELRKIYSNFHEETYHVEHLMKAAIIIAQKSQVVYNMKGDRVKGLAMSVNEMIKLNDPLNQLTNIVNIFATHSKAIQSELREELLYMVGSINLGCSMYSKFKRGIQYFDFQEVVNEKYGYINAFKSFTWLFFLQARQHLNIQTSNQSDYLLISILYLTVRYAFAYIRPRNIHINYTANSQKNLVTSILNRLFQIFIIDDISSFKVITGLVDDYFDSLISQQGLKCNNFECYDFLSPNLINLNYRKIDLLYRKQKDPNSIDYRLFLHNRLQTLTPRRFSQISQNKQPFDKKNFKQKSFASHKILTFENQQHSSKNEEIERFQQIKLPTNVKVSPSNTKTPMIWAVHQSPSSPIQNFVYRQVRQGKEYLKQFMLDGQIFDCIKGVLCKYCDESMLEDKAGLTYNYYLILRGKYYNQESCSELDSALLAYSLLIMICSSAEMGVEAERVRQTLTVIRQQISTNGFGLWLINNSFTQLKQRLPTQLQQLVHIMDDLILNQLIWQQDSIYKQLALAYQQKSNIFMNKLFQNIQEKLQSNVVRLMTEFATIQNAQQIQKIIDKTIKYIIIKTPQLIYSHNLMQIVFCCVYLVFRAHHINIKFNEILTTFQQINQIKRGTIKRLINEVVIEVEEGFIVCNIIQFYNKFFLPFIKQHRQQIDSWYPLYYKPQNKNTQEVSKEQKMHRYKSFEMKQNINKRYTTQETEHHKPYNKLKTQSSPVDQLRKQDKLPTRNQTRMRSRPIDFFGCLNTQKTKSPNAIR